MKKLIKDLLDICAYKINDKILHILLFFTIAFLFSLRELIIIMITIELTQFEMMFLSKKTDENWMQWIEFFLPVWIIDTIADLGVNLLGVALSFGIQRYLMN